MELYQLKTFVTVAELGHLTRAAERLHISQPAVSGQMRSLEEELGVQLLDRTSRKLTATDSGVIFHQKAEAILEDMAQAEAYDRADFSAAHSARVELFAARYGREITGSVLDLGCGSGLLAVLGAYRGHSPILAMDIDQHAIESTRENALVNGFADRIEIIVGDAIVAPLPASDLVVANIERKLIEMLLQREGLPDRIIVSGLRIEDEVNMTGWELQRQIVLGGWRSALLTR